MKVATRISTGTIRPVHYEEHNKKPIDLSYTDVCRAIAAGMSPPIKVKKHANGEKTVYTPKHLNISRPVILTISLDKFEELIKNVDHDNPDVENEIKIVRRLITNRESARSSRERNKRLIDFLTARNELLEEQMAKAEDEIRSLREEMFFMKTSAKRRIWDE